MAAIKNRAKALVLMLLVITISAAAQQDAALVYGKTTPNERLSYRVKFNNGLRDPPGTVSLGSGGVTIRDRSNAAVLEIADQQLVSAVSSVRGREMPYIHPSAAFESGEDPRAAAMLLVTAIGWDLALGVTSIFRHSRHFVTITYLQDTDPQTETLQLSGKDARRLAEALQARCAPAAGSAEQ